MYRKIYSHANSIRVLIMMMTHRSVTCDSRHIHTLFSKLPLVIDPPNVNQNQNLTCLLKKNVC